MRDTRAFVIRFIIRVFSQVIRINVFPSYNSSNFLGDIALLTLSSDAEFTNYVTPVCLWDEKSDNLDEVVGKEGTVSVLQKSSLLSFARLYYYYYASRRSKRPTKFLLYVFKYDSSPLL